ISASDISFSAETLAHRRPLMRKNSVEAGCSFTVFAVLDSAKQRKRLLERTGSACRFDEGSAYLTGHDHGRGVNTMRSCQKYEFSKQPGRACALLFGNGFAAGRQHARHPIDVLRYKTHAFRT